jgi:hypothetical protein
MSYRSGNFSEFNHDPRLICNYGCGQNRLGFRLTSDNPLNGFNFVQWHQRDLFFQRHDMVAGIYNPLPRNLLDQKLQPSSEMRSSNILKPADFLKFNPWIQIQKPKCCKVISMPFF